jgi:death-on-curing protein
MIMGVLRGMRDEGMVDSALGKPLNQYSYGNPNLFDLATSYAYRIIKSHPFIDGNKRTGYCEAGALSGLAEHHAR